MLFRKNEPNKKAIVIGERPLDEAIRFVQNIITDEETWDESGQKNKQILEAAQAGEPEAVKQAEMLVRKVLEKYKVSIPNMTTAQAAYEIYKYAWGLDVIEDLYRDDSIDEIRVNGPEHVYVVCRGKNEKREKIKFKNNEHIKRIVSRMIMHDRGIALTSSTPELESVRKDGSRLTATCPPATNRWTFVLRKQTFLATPENMLKVGTMDEKILRLLILFIKGRANILISGNTGSGKTYLLRFLRGYTDPRLRIVSLETDRELRYSDYYPDRDIVEFEEHEDIGLSMNKLFRLVLRYSPDIIDTGEIRGKGEAIEAIKSCTRGHDGSGSTVHFNSPQEAIEGSGKMMLEEGLRLPLNIAMTWVAAAFNIVIQMFSDSRRGIKKITHITEVWAEGDKINYKDLIVWEPNPEDYFKGKWVWKNKPSEGLMKKFRKYGVTSDDLCEAGVGGA